MSLLIYLHTYIHTFLSMIISKGRAYSSIYIPTYEPIYLPTDLYLHKKMGWGTNGLHIRLVWSGIWTPLKVENTSQLVLQTQQKSILPHLFLVVAYWCVWPHPHHTYNLHLWKNHPATKVMEYLYMCVCVCVINWN